MRSFEKPSPEYVYDPAAEITALLDYRETKPGRAVPQPTAGQLLVGSWNVANLGVHKRRDCDHRVIAEIISWFELVAIQEVADDLEGLMGVKAHLPGHFEAVFTDKAGNDERAAYFFDTRRVRLASEIGEIAITESERDDIRLPTITRPFTGFNRNPYIASFTVEGEIFELVNVHLYYGSMETDALEEESLERRQLEAYAVGRWCDLRRKSKHAYSRNIVALGDFNLPERAPGDPVYEAITERGLRLPPHTTQIPGTNLKGSADYDQIAFVPGLKNRISGIGVFDFDGAIFGELWDSHAPGHWRTCTKYYISDHRPLWTRFQLN